MAKEMKTDNERSIRITMYILFFLLFLDVLFLGLIIKRTGNRTIPVALGVVFLLLIIRRFSVLRVVVFETSEYLLSLKYRHPLLQSKKRPPVLEIPLDKVEFCRIERRFQDYYLIVRISTSRGKRNFYFRLGILSRKQTGNFKKTVNEIQSKNQ